MRWRNPLRSDSGGCGGGPSLGQPRKGSTPQNGGFDHEDYSNNPYGYPAQGYNYPNVQPPPGVGKMVMVKDNFNNDNNLTNKQIQGVNGGQVTM